MRRPTCCHCHKAFEHKRLLKLTTVPFKPICCPHCGTVQYVKTSSKMKVSLFNSMLVFIFLLLSFMNLPFILLLPLYTFLAMIFLLINPYFFEFNEKEEPLW